jgi:nucleoside-diphosphate-sugar epimerase
MRVFVTGATGFIGSVVVQELLSDGYEVVGLARSDEAAKSLTAAGALAHRGDVEDLDSLRTGASESDGVIHLGFIHDFSRFAEVCDIDRRAIETLGSALVGTSRPFVVTSGVAVARTLGRATTEDDAPNSPMPRVATEQAAEFVAERGVHTCVLRLPQVHNPEKQGLITPLVAIAREKGVSAYVGDGLNRWPAVARTDAARLYKLAFEKGVAGARYNAVGEEGVTMKDIAAAIGRGLKIPVVSISPEEASDHFGWLGMFVGHDMLASSALTQERLGWHPTGPGLIHDLDLMSYG